jgi:recombination endonuclease VII
MTIAPGRRNECTEVFGDQQKKRAAGRRHYLAHREDILARLRHRWKTDPQFRERKNRTIRKQYLLRKYGMSLEQYDALLASQNGACAICKKRSPQTLCVDHCHKTNFVRGLLCRKCNSSIGFCGDEAETVSEASAYLRAARQRYLSGHQHGICAMATADRHPGPPEKEWSPHQVTEGT